MTANGFVRLAGLFLLNCLLAVYATAPFVSLVRLPRETPNFVLKQEFAESVIAFVVGYFVYRRWRWTPAKWVWLAGLCWLSQRALRVWLDQHGPLSAIHGSRSVYWQMSGGGCPYDRESCLDWGFYTILFLRAVFYSAGAWFCAWFRKYELAALPNLKKAILALRR